MKTLFTFPGQGAQSPGLLHQLPDHLMSHELLDETFEVLKCDPLSLDNKIALQKTGSVQLCLLITGVIHARLFISSGVTPDFASGFSIGAFSAAVISGAISFKDAVRLVALRGELMEKAYPCGYGLTAIVGLGQRQIEPLIVSVFSQDQPVYLANINAEDQIVIAGSELAMQKVGQLAKTKGATKVQRLRVSVPSHCALLDEQAGQLRHAMKSVNVSKPNIAYLSGNTGRVLWQPEDIASDLAFNMAKTVHWHDAMRAAYERDVRLVIEMPPGSVLTRLARPIQENGYVLSCAQLGLGKSIEMSKYYNMLSSI
ncbi:malonate decarboxylase subunit epsilon [Xenorhabdus sp. IM139775]|uniref:malonate decarboxylase subunit epsilon n=1 Tax=Xenorhabdus sp. IM139775 TaxID=3025876 RepID=UPI0023591636|nr:malonate decarboxylase subunit epsilon [Xenorhabdus sp. IM139775]MDC9592751.1 malonate decarboxylase subunit epsilon [Xenorhabdus sp. IM139775]